MEVVVEEDDIGIEAWLELAFAVAGSSDAGGVSAREAERGGEVDGEDFDGVANVEVEGGDAADDGAIGFAGVGAVDGDGFAGEDGLAGIDAGEVEVVADDDGSVGAEEPPGEAEDGGLDVGAIEDEFAGDGGLFEGSDDGAAFALVDWAHGVEEVGGVADAGFEALAGLGVGGVGVTERGDGAEACDGMDEGQGTRELWGDGYLANGALGGGVQGFVFGDGGWAEVVGGKGAASRGVEVGAFKVEAEGLGSALAGGEGRGEGAEAVHGGVVVGAEGGDEEGGDSVGGRPGGVGVDLGRVVGEKGVAAAAVDVDVDEPWAGGEPVGFDDVGVRVGEVAADGDELGAAAEEVAAEGSGGVGDDCIFDEKGHGALLRGLVRLDAAGEVRRR